MDKMKRETSDCLQGDEEATMKSSQIKSSKMTPKSPESAQKRRDANEIQNDELYVNERQAKDAAATSTTNDQGCSNSHIDPFSRKTSYTFKRRLKRVRKISIVLLYAWLFMINDPGYAQKILGTMVASRVLSRALLRPMMMAAGGGGFRSGAFDASAGNRHGGLSTVEAIALIQAINSQRGGQHFMDLPSPSGLVVRPQNHGFDHRQLVGFTDQNMLARQAGPGLIPIAVLLAAVAAFLAAVLAGATPLAALIAAFFAAAAALVAALLALLALLLPGFDHKYKNSPIVKKLIIKKTVLPFVIPIPFKKKEKEVIYKYIPKPVHHHIYHEKHGEKKYKKHRKSDGEIEGDLTEKRYLTHVDKVESVVSEQDRIQTLVDNVIESSNDRS